MGLSSILAPGSIAKPGVCTSSTRPASPYEGQVIYETDTDKTLVWNGSAWVFLSTSTANPVGLEFIKSQTVGTAVSSVNVTSVFSSTYDNYRIVVNNMDASNDGADIRFGLDGITTGWYWNGYYMQAASSTLSGINGGNQAFAVVGQTGTQQCGFSIDVMNPNLSAGKLLTGGYGSAGSNAYVGNMHATCNQTTSCTAFTLTFSTGTVTGGTIRVYGYRNS